MKIKNLILLIFILSLPILAQKDESDRQRNQPVEPFRIIGNIYYVGAAEVASYLITTPKGHILLDGGYAETAPQIRENIRKLGFKIKDVKFLLNSQAHFDHAGGLAELKRLTNATMIASEADKILLENGGKGDFRFGDDLSYEPVTVDKIIRNEEKVTLGGSSLKAVLTPGHTKGCTTWMMTVEENNRKYKVVFVGSTTSLDYKLKGNEKYPNIAADYETTFARMKKLKPDVFLASHGSFFNLLEKAEELKKGKSPNPFIDRENYMKYIENTEKDFREKLAKQ